MMPQQQQQIPKEPRLDFAERHYTANQLAEMWNLSPRLIRQWFRDEAGVIRFGTDVLRKGRKRIHVTLRIPESVARRVYRWRTDKEAKILP